MTENEISKIILDCAFKVNTKLGSGLLEKVYRQALAYELNKSGLIAEQEVVVPVYYEEIKALCWIQWVIKFEFPTYEVNLSYPVGLLYSRNFGV